jgi:hypothetical protein
MHKLNLVPAALVLAVAVMLPAGMSARAAPLSASDRVTSLPQIANATGPRVESTFSNKLMGYTVVLKQFKSPLLTVVARQKLAANDTVMRFDIRWRHGERELSGLLHAFRHGTQLHLSVHQKVYFSDRAEASSTTHPKMVAFDLEGTVDGVRKDAKGFLIGTRVKVDFRAKLPGDIFGSRLILSGPLSIKRIGV